MTETTFPPAVYVEIPYIYHKPVVHEYCVIAMTDDTTMTGQILLIKPGEYTKLNHNDELSSFVKAVVYLIPKEHSKSISFAADEIPAFEFYQEKHSALPPNYITNQIKYDDISEMKKSLKRINENITKIIESIE